MPELWLTETAEYFWQRAGDISLSFEEALLFALPLTTEKISNLDLNNLSEWFYKRNLVLREVSHLPNRPLRACLVVYSEQLSFIFLDSADSQPHQKFSLAHEVAHYLLDYHLPRQKVIERLTKTTLEVLDGLRQPTLTERVSGLLEGVELTPHTHFMERGAEGDILSREILRIEERADRLALELLAPYKQAYPAVRDGVHNLTGKSVRLQAAFTVLQETFKLPPNVARAYTQRLLSDLGEGDSTRNWLFGE